VPTFAKKVDGRVHSRNTQNETQSTTYGQGGGHKPCKASEASPSVSEFTAANVTTHKERKGQHPKAISVTS